MKTVTFKTLSQATSFIAKLNSLDALWGRNGSKSKTVEYLFSKGCKEPSNFEILGE